VSKSIMKRQQKVMTKIRMPRPPQINNIAPSLLLDQPLQSARSVLGP
jgi:hypothetical protein